MSAFVSKSLAKALIPSAVLAPSYGIAFESFLPSP